MITIKVYMDKKKNKSHWVNLGDLVRDLDIKLDKVINYIKPHILDIKNVNIFYQLNNPIEWENDKFLSDFLNYVWVTESFILYAEDFLKIMARVDNANRAVDMLINALLEKRAEITTKHVRLLLKYIGKNKRRIREEQNV